MNIHVDFGLTRTLLVAVIYIVTRTLTCFLNDTGYGSHYFVEFQFPLVVLMC
jgi:hypothetical protein